MNAFECLFYMSYMYTRKHHKEDSSVRISDESDRGSRPKWKDLPFPLMTKGERFIRCRGQRHGSRGSIGHIDAGMVPGGA
jgi:hypothetical protein